MLFSMQHKVASDVNGAKRVTVAPGRADEQTKWTCSLALSTRVFASESFRSLFFF